MTQIYKTVYQYGIGEIVEKKSRFIATVRPVTTKEEAILFIEEIKKKYWDATHNCFAYVLGLYDDIQRYNDDGEPNGTAGKPMLDILLKEEIHDVAVVVTRYFGGTKLGTGGLIRAYSKAVQEGLEQSLILEATLGSKLVVITDYNEIGKIQYLIGQLKLNILEIEYQEVIRFALIIQVEQVDAFKKKIVETTSGKCQIQQEGDAYFSVVKGNVVLFHCY